MKRLFILSFALAVHFAMPCAAQKQLPKGLDNSWRVSVTMSRSTTDKWKSDYGIKTSTSNFELHLSTQSAAGTLEGSSFRLSTPPDDNWKPYVKPLVGGIFFNYNLSNTADGCTTKQSGSAQPEPQQCSISFEYDREKKEGTFSLAPPADNDQYHAAGEGSWTCKSDATAQEMLRENAKEQARAGAMGCLTFSAQNFRLQGMPEQLNDALNICTISETKSGYQIIFSKSETKAYDGGTTTITTSLTASITNQPAKYEAILESGDEQTYKDFIPEGPKLDGSTDAGNKLEFRVRILDKSKGGADVTDKIPFTATYTLADVSRYKGYCMNYPKEGGNTDADLRWDTITKTQNHLASVTETTLQSTAREGNYLVVSVACYDYAAYGLIKAKVHLDDEDIDLDAHAKDRPEELLLRIPVDDNNNKIADKWEKDAGMWGKTADATFDEDAQPKEQRRDGDGYTMWEEYRGFKVKDNLIPPGAHEIFKEGLLRMDPQYKDIFIEDRSGLFQQWYAPYNPSNLCWHYITADEMKFTGRGNDPDNRWVNFNKEEAYFHARQYGLIMEAQHGINGGGVMGITTDNDGSNIRTQKNVENQMAIDNEIEQIKAAMKKLNDEINPKPPETSFGFDQPVKNSSMIAVYVDEMTRVCKFLPAAMQQSIYSIVLKETVNHEIGHAIGITHHKDERGQETEKSQASGLFRCVMRYSSKVENEHNYAPDITPYYCHKNDTWDEIIPMTEEEMKAAGGKAVALKRKSHPSNNCYGQIDVKSD